MLNSNSRTFVTSFATLVAVLLTLASAAYAAPAAKKVIIATSSAAADPAARQIVRSVANESLKPISTKNDIVADHDHDAATVEHADDVGPIVMPAKIASEPAPGTRAPAAKEAAVAEPAEPELRGTFQKADPAAAHVATNGHEGHNHDDHATASQSHDATRETASEKSADKSEHHTAAPVKETVSTPLAAPVAKGVVGHTVKDGSVPAEKALSWLQNGNKRFVKKQLRSDGKSQADRERLSKGQHPHAIVLSCADSRVPPETVFDQSLGEVFTVRTAGEALDSAVIASLEYAVEHLGPRLLIVMGHTSCGAVAATIGAKEGVSSGSPSIDALIADMRPRIPTRSPAAASKNLEIESSSNAQGVAADLLKRSDIIRARVEKGDLVIKPALYHLDSGVVNFY